MMAGRVSAVSALLRQHAPELILNNSKASSRADLDVHFYINCMQFIELIRRAPLLMSLGHMESYCLQF